MASPRCGRRYRRLALRAGGAPFHPCSVGIRRGLRHHSHVLHYIVPLRSRAGPHARLAYQDVTSGDSGSPTTADRRHRAVSGLKRTVYPSANQKRLAVSSFQPHISGVKEALLAGGRAGA